MSCVKFNTIACEACGKTVVPKNTRQRFCSLECRNKQRTDAQEKERLQRIKSFFKTLLYVDMQETELSPIVVSHPFFESAFLCEPTTKKVFNALEDKEAYVSLLEGFKTSIENATAVSELMMYITKPYRLAVLKQLRELCLLSARECGNELGKVFQGVELLSYGGVGKITLLSWFRKADKESLMDLEELAFYKALPPLVTVYRGIKERKYLKGLSWSLDKETATWFARRFGSGGFVCEAVVPKESVLCYKNYEDEVIVDYREIKIQSITWEE